MFQKFFPNFSIDDLWKIDYFVIDKFGNIMGSENPNVDHSLKFLEGPP